MIEALAWGFIMLCGVGAWYVLRHDERKRWK